MESSCTAKPMEKAWWGMATVQSAPISPAGTAMVAITKATGISTRRSGMTVTVEMPLVMMTAMSAVVVITSGPASGYRISSRGADQDDNDDELAPR
jgi:hypothetical protein